MTDKMNRDTEDIPTIMTIEQLAETTPAFSSKTLRQFLKSRKTNGLSSSGAVIHVGKRLWLDQEKFMSWLLAHAENK